MRNSTLVVSLLVLIGCVLFSQEAKGQNVWGYSSISYNNTTHYVTATSTTELDYFVQEYYKARVNSMIVDENGYLVIGGYATDNYQSGYVSLTLQAYNTTAKEYEVIGTHFGIAVYYDYAIGPLRYRDYYDYTSFADFAYDYFSDYGFLGRGPERRTTGSIYQVGKTHSYDQASAVKVGMTLKTSGTIVPAPENEDYDYEVQTSGTDQLGPLPMGEGRALYPGYVYTSPLMMIGQVTPSSAYSGQFQWVRYLRRRSWYIRKSPDGTQWLVTQRSKRPDQSGVLGYVDDSSPTGATADDTPSATGKIYMYDNSSLAPTDGNGSALQVGDFIREEKDFVYLAFYYDVSTGEWTVAGRKDVGQIIIVKRTATTGVVVADWQGIENSNVARKLDVTIRQGEVRAIVGGTLSIVIDASTND